MANGSVRVGHAILCLAPLVPAFAVPGIGAFGSLALVVVALIFVRVSRQPTLAFVWRSAPRSLLLGVGAGLALAIAFNLIVDPLIERLAGPITLDDFARVQGNLVNYLMLLALGLIFGGIVEEVVFRGFVIGWGSRLFGARAGVALALLSAAVFGATHLYQSIAGAISTGLIGFALGLLYLYADRKLLPAIAAHMTINAYGVTLIYLGS